jgi:hypothetical protein
MDTLKDTALDVLKCSRHIFREVYGISYCVTCHSAQVNKKPSSIHIKLVLDSDIFVNENENGNENYCAFVNENENFLKNENRIRTKINLSERIEINY